EPSNALRLKIVSECPEPNWILAEISNFNAIVSYYPLDSTKIRLFFRYTRYVTNPLQQMNSTTYRDTLIDIRTSLVNGKWVGRIGPFPNDTTIFASVSIADVNGEYSRIAIDTNTFFIRTLRLGICDREAINFSSVRIDAKIPDDIQHKDGLYLSYKLSNLNSILNPDRRTMIVKVMWDTSDAYVLDPNLQIPGQQILNPADLLYDSTEYRIVSKGVFPGQKYHVTAFAMDTLGHWSTATRIKDTVTTPVPIPIADSVELKILADTAFSISYEKLRRYVPGTPNIELIKNAVFIISDSGPISPSLLVDPIERHYYLNGSNNVSSRTGRTFLIITRDIFLTSSYVVGVNEQILLDKNYWVYVAYLSGYEVSLPVLVDRLEYRPSKPYFKQTSAIQLNDSTLRISFRTYDTADVNLGVQIKYSINGNSPN
ncbi:MAG: hypothetical protein JNL74_20120, partial [Fibrobacteres bacterium]|nr:hypothetical protein [Fibrobacterota bacterium]